MRLDELNRIHSNITTIPCEQIVTPERRFQGKAIAGYPKINTFKQNAINHKAYIPDYWGLCVFLSLMLTPIFDICASTIDLINLYKNPVERFFNVFDLFIWLFLHF